MKLKKFLMLLFLSLQFCIVVGWLIWFNGNSTVKVKRAWNE